MENKKYINNTKTVILNSNWIPFGAEAFIRKEVNNLYVISFKDLDDTTVKKEIFHKIFVDAGVAANEEDMFEFNASKNIIQKNPIIKIVRSHYSGELQNLLESAIDKAHQDAYIAPGSTKCLNFKEYTEIVEGKYKGGSLEEKGSPFFNRRRRWSVIAVEEEWDKRGKPAPIGIRPEDYASLKECNAIFIELTKQIFSMQDIPDIPKEINKLITGIKPGNHICHYCGQKISILAFRGQAYKAKEHEINFCHIDPSEEKGRTRHDNIYFGHTKCNRVQGGLSEEERIIDGLRLLKLYKQNYLNKNKIKEEIKTLNQFLC